MSETRQQGIRRRTDSGERIEAGAIAITPQSEAVVGSWGNVGGVWNRPVAVIVEQGGQKRRIPIVNVTRRIQVGLFVLAVLFAAMTALLAAIEARRASEEGDDSE